MQNIGDKKLNLQLNLLLSLLLVSQEVFDKDKRI